MNIDTMIFDQKNTLLSFYGTFNSQELISNLNESLEQEAQQYHLSMGSSANISVVFIELTQNIMNYTKSQLEQAHQVASKAFIAVSQDANKNCQIHSQNIINTADKNKIDTVLTELSKMQCIEIRKRYKELRKSGQHSHTKGGGIGFYEIARRSMDIDFGFKKINEEQYNFYLTSTINLNKEQ